MSLLCEVYHLIWLSLNISTFNILITYSIMKYTGTTKQCLAIFKYTAWQLINAYEILVVLLLLLLSSASYYHPGLPWWLRQERIRLQCGRPGFDPWVGQIPWRRTWQPTPDSCLENPMDRGATEWLRVRHNWATKHILSPKSHKDSHVKFQFYMWVGKVLDSLVRSTGEFFHSGSHTIPVFVCICLSALGLSRRIFRLHAAYRII